VVVSWVPWARHGAGHTLPFDQAVAWKTTRMSKTGVAYELRISWATVGQVIARVTADLDAQAEDPYAHVRRIGIDEVSYKRGYKFLTVVVDHDTRRLLWIAEGHSKAVLSRFFTEMGPQRCAALELISADGADWIFHAVQDHCPQAKICLDPFHVVSWASKALDEVRRGMWRAIRRTGQKMAAADLRGARYALLKNPENLTDKQQTALAGIQATNQPLYRAYLLKEQLRVIFTAGGGAERALLLDAWLRWAARCQIPTFVDLARRIRTYFRDDIINTLTHRLSNGLIESTNTKIRLLTRMAYGFKSAAALIALVKLHVGAHNIGLPGRA